MRLTLLFLILTRAAAFAQDDAGRALAESARSQIGQTVRYDPAYMALTYPGGDPPIDRGVCTDVVIRALRKSGHDLQKLVHEDMAANFGAYPKLWGLKGPDRNIDHRRVPNLTRFFTRRGKSLPVTTNPSDYLPGDFVTCVVPPNLPHIMVVSDLKSEDGVPLVIHNIGAGAREENRLFDFKLTGHFRWSLTTPAKSEADPSPKPAQRQPGGAKPRRKQAG